ncbi:MAG TPA: glucose-6-phosphate isomerase family protein [Fimbriimonadaceae bacterium]|nr:glucose-6-phosphate isomerase family protein [Fimbriimonadaceae bacterium]HRJ32115.1 glucose-6-phosphate isomerase family protein [Fimbriimonadaceae bacterium]
MLTGPGVVSARRTLGELAPLFRHPVPASRQSELVYETFSMSPQAPAGSHELLAATTVLHPGWLEDEPFMTRGHFHIDPRLGESMLTLSGEGVLVLMNRSGEVQEHPADPGTFFRIEGEWAHRAVNRSRAPWVFLVTWDADCGHDYESISPSSFRLR